MLNFDRLVKNSYQPNRASPTWTPLLSLSIKYFALNIFCYSLWKPECSANVFITILMARYWGSKQHQTTRSARPSWTSRRRRDVSAVFSRRNVLASSHLQSLYLCNLMLSSLTEKMVPVQPHNCFSPPKISNVVWLHKNHLSSLCAPWGTWLQVKPGALHLHPSCHTPQTHTHSPAQQSKRPVWPAARVESSYWFCSNSASSSSSNEACGVLCVHFISLSSAAALQNLWIIQRVRFFFSPIQVI